MERCMRSLHVPDNQHQEHRGVIHSHRRQAYIPFLRLNDSRSCVVFSSFCLYNRHDQVLFHGLNMYRHLTVSILKSTCRHTVTVQCVCLRYLSQQLRDDFDLLSSREQVGQRHTRHSGHLHVVNHTHQLLQQAQWEVGVFQAVDSQATACLFVAIL